MARTKKSKPRNGRQTRELEEAVARLKQDIRDGKVNLKVAEDAPWNVWKMLVAKEKKTQMAKEAKAKAKKYAEGEKADEGLNGTELAFRPKLHDGHRDRTGGGAEGAETRDMDWQGN